jgi:hypothetical protein
MTERHVALLATVLICAAMPRARAAAQERAHVQPELRLDVIDPRSPDRGTVQLGAGLAVPLGYYARLGLIGAGGISREGGDDHGSARADVLMRFLIDPFRETTYGVSVGGGLSLRYAREEGWQEYLAIVVDVETPPVRSIVPALQVGLGGGVRIGVGLRRAQQGRR